LIRFSRAFGFFAAGADREPEKAANRPPNLGFILRAARERKAGTGSIIPDSCRFTPFLVTNAENKGNRFSHPAPAAERFENPFRI